MATGSEASFLTFLMSQYQLPTTGIQTTTLVELQSSLAIAAAAAVGAGGVAHAVEW